MTGYNLIDNVQHCQDLIRNSYPLGLIYYSHLIATALSLIVGAFVFFKDRGSLVGKLLLAVSLTFSLWVGCNLVAWSSADGQLVFFAWSFFGMLTAFLFMQCLYLSYVFFFKKDISFFWKHSMMLALLPVLALTATRYNLLDFSVYNDCEVTENLPFYSYYYFLGVAAFLWILAMAIKACKEAEAVFRRQIFIFAAGIEIFIFLFFVTGFWGTLTGDYNTEFYGILGMALFMGLLGYLIVEYNAFNVRMISAQAIMIVLVLLIAAQFTFAQSKANEILAGLALLLSAVFGWQLVASIKKEIAQKEELVRANAELERADRTKNEFINIASHQLRTPTTVIKGVLSVIRSGEIERVDKGVKMSLLDGAMGKCNKLVEIIDDILNATTLANSKYSVMDKDTEDIDVAVFLKDLVKGFAPEVLARDIDLEVAEIDGSAPAIQGQRSYLEEAFSNLIGNAIKYTPSLSPSAEIQISRKDKGRISIGTKRDGEFLVFSIRDNGIGIPNEEFPDLFKKFYRAQNACEMYVDGSGLGLFIVKEIVEGHGGSVWVESELDKGSTFFVKLPIRQEGKVDVKKVIEERASLEM